MDTAQYDHAKARTAVRLCLLEGSTSLGLQKRQTQSLRPNYNFAPEFQHEALCTKKHNGQRHHEASRLGVHVSLRVVLKKQRCVDGESYDCYDCWKQKKESIRDE